MNLSLRAVGLAAPGLPDWARGRPILAGRQPWAPQAESPYAPQLLPPNERRRAPPGVRQAFRAGEDARSGCTLDFSQLATVFATSDSDLSVMERICVALADAQRAVSPIDFHNSVHNAAGGYWSIATASHKPSTSVGGHDGSFAAGLVEAAALVRGENLATLLVAFDVPPPALMQAKRLLTGAGSIALVVDDGPGEALAFLDLELVDEPETPLADPALEALRGGNPALRGLALLSALARGGGRVVLPHVPGCALAVTVAPA